MPMVTANPQPRVMLVKPPWMTSPGFFVGNSTTIATTPVPNRMRTNVPRNSARSSAVKPGFEVIASPARDSASEPRSSLPRGGGTRLFFPKCDRPPVSPTCVLRAERSRKKDTPDNRPDYGATGSLGVTPIRTFLLDIWDQSLKIENIYSL